MNSIELDIVIPVYNEGETIVTVLKTLASDVQTFFRVLICYDFDNDTTLAALAAFKPPARMQVQAVKNSSTGAHSAVMTGMQFGVTPFVLTYPADDTFNSGIIEDMLALAREGCEIVVASRFVPGGCMQGCPWLKAVLVRSASYTLYRLAGLPVQDASNGLRLFSRRVLTRIPVESRLGFCYSLELLAKCHRLGWRIGEVPARWFERDVGSSRFRLGSWLPGYLRWYLYVFATRFLRRREVRGVASPPVPEAPGEPQP